MPCYAMSGTDLAHGAVPGEGGQWDRAARTGHVGGSTWVPTGRGYRPPCSLRSVRCCDSKHTRCPVLT
eukprot:2173502-Rhodomonas_salina.1